MQLTQEQINIINSTGDIKINAVAGSGKTTTLVEYAKARRNSKILYIAFNKTVKLEAIRKFSENSLNNVRVETAHSLAFKSIVPQYNYQIKPNGYKIYEIADLLNISVIGDRYTRFIIANHINKFVSYYCNNKAQAIEDFDYKQIVTSPQAITFVDNYYTLIRKKTIEFISKMDNGELEIIHDFYLKKFQLSSPILNYDFILFDEGQDASEVMYDIFVNQKATKVIVGDTHQQIYGWRYAINTLEKAEFDNYNLSTSFRFNQNIADLAMSILDYKHEVKTPPNIEIIGNGNSQSNNTKVVIGRTNIGLLIKAIDYIVEKKAKQKIYFEGNIHSYTYAENGSSLYDVLNLYNEKQSMVKDKLIKEMKNVKDLEDYIKKTDDMQLSMMLELVKEYGNEIPRLLQKIKDCHVEDDKKHEAEIIFSTVHKCKGMEYDNVQLVNDFINKERIDKMLEDIGIDKNKTYDNTNKKGNEKTESEVIAKIIEELNILYVAITRTKNRIFIPIDLIPDGFPEFPNIKRLKSRDVSEVANTKSANFKSFQESLAKPKKARTKREPRAPRVPKSNNLNYVEVDEFGNEKISEKKTLDQIRESHKAAYMPWDKEQDDELLRQFVDDEKISDIAHYFGRSKGAIIARLRKFGIEIG
jgi:superfamily I DNA/RNA helicase